jgi:transposase
MRVPLKLNSIEQEHLQELYDAAGIARDELPYSDKFEEIWAGFQDRTFKNAEREQVFGAILKYVRSSSNSASGKTLESKVSEEQLKQLKALLPRHARGVKLLPYSDEIDAARKEFAKHTGIELSEQEFWQAIQKSQGPKRVPPPRRKAAAAKVEEDVEEDGE